MNEQRLHLVQIELQSAALMRFAAAQGLARVADDGHGYALHAWLAAVFGPLAPKPFRLMPETCTDRRVLLGYARSDGSTLTEHAHAFADPAAFAVLASDEVPSKPMPATWREGRSVGFEALCCPMSRKENFEKDVYLRALDRLGDAAPEREQVYRDWFTRQLTEAATTIDVRVGGVSRGRMTRRSHAPGGGRRLVEVERPQALFNGTLTIRDTASFTDLLARGIGRHRAFGFGMLLLRQPG